MMRRQRLHAIVLALLPALAGQPAMAQPAVGHAAGGLQTEDLFRLRSVGDVQIAPDGRFAVYAVSNADRPGRPYSQVWMLDVAAGTSRRLGGNGDTAGDPLFSPDGKHLAFIGRIPAGAGVVVADADGSSPQLIAPIEETNHPLPSSGARLAWSPDSTRLAFISAVPGPEADANGDPMVITRYLYKPTASEGGSRANDNRRLHIFVADVAAKTVKQLTDGVYYEHSIDWSPKGDEILFVSNRGPDPDRFFNYDVFTVAAATGSVRRLTDTKSAEYYPRWSPDGRLIAFSGTKRPLTSSETTMEDTHVWVMDAAGGNRREVGTVDNRQGAPEWSRDGRSLYATIQERGEVRLLRFPTAGGAPERLIAERGSVGQWALASDGTVIYAFATPARPAELYVRTAASQARAVTTLNDQVLGGRTLAEVESVRFTGFDGLRSRRS
jgi:Tol biopolymer transport system component